MAKTRQQKELTVQQLVEKLTAMKALMFSSFSGLSVKDATTLRRQLRDEQVDFVVAPKNLFRLALKQTGFDPEISSHLSGGAALVFGYQDEVTPAKLIQQFGKDHPAVALVGGVMEGEWIDANQAQALAKLPGRKDLLAQTVWTIKSPLSGLANVLSGNLRGLMNVLQARKAALPA